MQTCYIQDRVASLLGYRARDTELRAKCVLMWLDLIQKMSSFCCTPILNHSHRHQPPPNPPPHCRQWSVPSPEAAKWMALQHSLVLLHSFMSVLHPNCLQASVWAIRPQRRVKTRLHHLLPKQPFYKGEGCQVGGRKGKKISDRFCHYSGDFFKIFWAFWPTNMTKADDDSVSHNYSLQM